jgi:hypothetical protein
MANEAERLSVKLASAKGGALLWIARCADRGHPLNGDEFVQEFAAPPFDAEYGQDLLDELRRGGLVEEQPDGRLSIASKALDWIDHADFWHLVAEDLTST